MKNKNEKKGLVPLPEQPKHLNGEKNDNEVKQSGLSKLVVTLTAVILGFMQTEGEKMNSSSFEDIENNSILINQIGFFMTFFNSELICLLKEDNNRLNKKLEIKNKAKSKAPKIEEKCDDLKPEKMAMVNSGVIVFAKIIGNIVENLKNKKGNRLIEVDNTTLAKMLASNFKLIDGDPLNSKSLAIYIGQGRKMESIINLDVLSEFFK
jgi:hypothetical protein